LKQLEPSQEEMSYDNRTTSHELAEMGIGVFVPKKPLTPPPPPTSTMLQQRLSSQRSKEALFNANVPTSSMSYEEEEEEGVNKQITPLILSRTPQILSLSYLYL
jgi:hypothetical protein